MLGADPQLAATLNTQRVAAWVELDRATNGNARSSWNRRTVTPERIELGSPWSGASPAEAFDSIETGVGTVVRALIGHGSDDVLVLQDQDEGATDDGVGGEERLHHARRRHGRQHRGLPAFDDWHETAIRERDSGPNGWDGFMRIRWTPGLERVSITDSIGREGALTAARASGEVVDGVTAGEPELGFHSVDPLDPRLAWNLVLADGPTAWRYRIDAATGAILGKWPQSFHDDGSLEIPVGLPRQGNTKIDRALPYATLYEDYLLDSSATATCYWTPPTISQWAGDTAKDLGTTSYWGSYSGVFPFQPGDTSWTVDFRGPYAKDVSNVSILDMDTFPSGTSHTFTAQTNHHRSRRGELFYLLNYGRQQYKVAYTIPQFEPLHFFYYDDDPVLPDNDCQDPSHPHACCGGYANYANGCVEIYCYGAGSVAHEVSERRFREVAWHEQNHTLRIKANGTLVGGCHGTATVDGEETGCWEEGRAMLGALAISAFEGTREEYEPGLLYPDDFSNNLYNGGALFTAVYGRHILNVGVAPGLKGIHHSLADPDVSTRMVGSCVDSSGDGHVTVSECPSNSFYRHMLDSDAALWSGRYRRDTEISDTFHFHVTDASRALAGAQTFPWADEMPAHRTSPPFLPVESGGAKNVTAGPGEGSGSLRLTSSSDYDTIMFHARAGESYYIETTGLASGMDTYLEVLDKTGYETVLASDDDCGASTRSCLTFAPGSSGYYRVRVSPIFGSATGPSKTYTLRVTTQNDDYGDDIDNAHAYYPGWWKGGQMHSAGDVDVFKLVSRSSQTLTYLGCPTSGSFPVRVQVVDSLGLLIDTHDSTTCSGFTSVTIGSGVYFLKVSSPTGATGTYNFATFGLGDIDIDSTPENAWTLTNDARSGRVLATSFDDAADEDWFQFTSTQQGRWFVVETWGLAGSVDTQIEIYAPDDTIFGRTGTLDVLPDTSGQGEGHWMLRDDNGAIDDGGSRLAFVTPVAGTYYVRVINSGTGTGPYQLMFEETNGSVPWTAFP